jgi:hypothetical protein
VTPPCEELEEAGATQKAPGEALYAWPFITGSSKAKKKVAIPARTNAVHWYGPQGG